MITLNIVNFVTVTSNTHVLDLILRCLLNGDRLVIANDSCNGQYVCSSDLGMVKRVGNNGN